MYDKTDIHMRPHHVVYITVVYSVCPYVCTTLSIISRDYDLCKGSVNFGIHKWVLG